MTAYHPPERAVMAKRKRWQSRLAAAAGIALFWGLISGLAFTATWSPLPFSPRWARAGHADAAELLAGRTAPDTAHCRAALRRAGISFSNIDDRAGKGLCTVRNALKIDAGAAPLSPSDAVLTCTQALAYARWERLYVQTSAFEHFGAVVSRVDHYGSLSCRHEYGEAALPVSQHAYANAIDIAGFELADGRYVSVSRDWRRDTPEGAFLKDVRNGACETFSVTLSPDFNAAHADHLHLDMGGGKVCS